MRSFTVALALAASMVEANYYHQQGYSTPIPSSYPQHGQGHYAQNYQQQHYQQQHYQQQHYDPNSAHIHQQTYGIGSNGDATNGEVGWWSQFQQYSPPLIKYEIADLEKPVFTICDPAATGYWKSTDSATITGSVKITQRPNEAAKLSADIAGAVAPSLLGVSALRLDVYEYGLIDDDCTPLTQAQSIVAGETDMGEIFFPLQEKKLGVTNPYADPERGVIKDIPATSGDIDDPDYTQDTLLMNLGGDDSIVGRSILMTWIVAENRSDPASLLPDPPQFLPTAEVMGCCVIAHDVEAEASALIATQIWHGHGVQQYHHQPQQSNPLNHKHAYNSYGGSQGKYSAPSHYGRY